MSAETMFVHQAIAQAVHAHDTDVVFGLMGDANLFMVDHFVRRCEGNFVPSVHEGNSVLMALSYAHISGKTGVATVTHGPALTNCVTALAEAARGNISLVLLAGDTPVINPGHLQNIDQREVVKATGAEFIQMRSTATVAQDVAKAFYVARMERCPVVLNIPADFMWQEIQYEQQISRVFETPNLVPEGQEFENAIGIIASAKRPLILAGGGAFEAREALIKLADRLEAPLATTLKAKGLFNDHPFNIDIFGTLSTDAAYELIDKSDCIICFGAGLHDFTTDKGKLISGKRIVQIDIRRQAIGRNLQPDAALLADATLTAENIVYWLDEAEIPATGFTKEIDPASLKGHRVPTKVSDRQDTLDFIHALEQLETALPQKRNLITDGGRFMTEVWCRISVSSPKNFVVTANFGSIGLGLQEAVGAAIAAPDRPTILFTGDGGFMMGGINEFNTAVRLKQDLIVIVCNDAAYGAEHIQFRDKQMDPSLTEFDWPSFANLAIALGGEGVEVRSEQDLAIALQAIQSRTKPLLIELHLDPDDVPRMRA